MMHCNSIALLGLLALGTLALARPSSVSPARRSARGRYHGRLRFAAGKSPTTRVSAGPPPGSVRECGECARHRDCAGFSVCHANMCVLNGGAKAQSLAKCFPNLVECAFCFQTDQCGAGSCYRSRCLRSADDATLFTICGVRTRALAPRRWTPRWLRGRVHHGFSAFKHKFGF